MNSLFIKSLNISHFRSHKISNFEFNSNPIVFFGKNGVGKTNILEAISLFSPGKGLKGSSRDDFVKMPDGIGWKIKTLLKKKNITHEISTFGDHNKNRTVFIDGKKSSQLELGEVVRMLWITPAMDRLFLESSFFRRKFLDRLVLNFFPSHGKYSLKYNNALKQRNMLLKDRSSDLSWFNSIEKQMVKFGYEIELARKKTIDMLNFEANQNETKFISSKISLISKNIFTKEIFEKSLNEGRRNEIFIGRTLVGPHKSDFEVIFNEKNMNAKNCSTGEQKTLLISILSSTVRAHIRYFDIAPILLLDEISAHLDEKTRILFYEELSFLKVQAFLTGTDKIFFDSLLDKSQLFKIMQNENESFFEELS